MHLVGPDRSQAGQLLKEQGGGSPFSPSVRPVRLASSLSIGATNFFFIRFLSAGVGVRDQLIKGADSYCTPGA